MKLLNVLKGHVSDNCIVVIDTFNYKLEWSGKGIKHMLEKYNEKWLKKDVVNVTKKRNKTIIYIK